MFPLLSPAQNAWDALRYSQVNYQGTARSMALGNAVTALGGDFGSIAINPAGSAVYPYGEVVFTPGFSLSHATADYVNRSTKNDFTRFGISNLAYVSSHATGNAGGLRSVSFAVGLNKTNDYTLRSTARSSGVGSSWLSPLALATSGYTPADLEFDTTYNPYYDSSAPWKSIMAWNCYLLDLLPDSDRDYIAATENLYGNDIFVPGPLTQQFMREATGNTTEYLLNMAVNIDHRLFAGASLTLQNTYYDYSEHFTETTEDPLLFDTSLSSYRHTYEQTAKGVGVNLKLGLIYLPTNNLRLGISFTSPTWISMSEFWSETLSARFRDNSEEAQSPEGSFNYSLRTPLRFDLGIACTFAGTGLLSIDYEGADYRTMLLKGRGSDRFIFDEENDAIRNTGDYDFRYVNNLRIGAEFKISPFAFRVGYNYMSKPEASCNNTQIASAGIGFRSNAFFMDLTGAYRIANSETFSLYDDVPGVLVAPRGTMTTDNLKLLFSIGFRF